MLIFAFATDAISRPSIGNGDFGHSMADEWPADGQDSVHRLSVNHWVLEWNDWGRRRCFWPTLGHRLAGSRPNLLPCIREMVMFRRILVCPTPFLLAAVLDQSQQYEDAG